MSDRGQQGKGVCFRTLALPNSSAPLRGASEGVPGETARARARSERLSHSRATVQERVRTKAARRPPGAAAVSTQGSAGVSPRQSRAIKSSWVAARILGCSVILGLGGCATEEESSIEIKLVVDPTINSEEQVLSIIDTVAFILDSEKGFDLSQSEEVSAFQVVDVDEDGVQELVVSIPLDGEKSFPPSHLLPGRNHFDKHFSIAAAGYANGELVARGDPAQVAFAEGRVLSVSLALNLIARYQPPRVISMSYSSREPPDDKAPPPFGSWPMVMVFLSKTVEPGSVAGHCRLLWGEPPQEREVFMKAEVTEIQALENAELQKQTQIIFYGCALSPGTYRLVLDEAIQDDEGRPLTQNAQLAQLGYSASFTIGESSGSASCDRYCQNNEDCSAWPGMKCLPIFKNEDLIEGICEKLPPGVDSYPTRMCNANPLLCVEPSTCQLETRDCVP